MTGDDDGGPRREPIAETLDEVLAGEDSQLRAGLLNVLALLPKVGVARWVLHRAGLLSVALAPVGLFFPDPVPPEAIDAALGELAEAGLVTIDEAEFDEADTDTDTDTADADVEDPGLDVSAFDTVTVNPEASEILIARQAAAGTVAELGERACAMLDEAARSGAGIDYALLADGMTACWDSLQPYLGPADDELVRDLLVMRAAGGAQLINYLYVGAAELTEFAESLVADAVRVLGSGHPDTWDAQRNLAHSYGRCQRTAEAITVLAQLRADIERVLPADDGEVLAARDELGFGYMNAGRYQDAIREFFSLLADCARVMGPHDNWTLHARRQLGEAYLEAGLVSEGVELMEAAAAGFSALFGPDAPQVTSLREAISEARDQQAGPR